MNSSNDSITSIVTDAVLDTSTLNLREEDIYPDANIHLLFADSLEFFEFITCLEDYFDINLTINNVKSLSDIIDLISKEIACKGN